MAEYQRFTFDPRAVAPDAVRIDYASPLVDRFVRIMQDLGRAAVARAVPLRLKPLDPDEAFTRGITVTNGVVRDCRVEEGRARYVGFFVEHELLADERVSGLTEVWVNTSMRSAPRLAGLSRTLAARADGPLEADAEPGAPADVAAIIADGWNQAAARARRAVEDRLRETVDSLVRRRDREFARLLEYYESIDHRVAAATVSADGGSPVVMMP